MQRLILLVLTAVLAVALGAGQYYVPRSYYVIDDEGHQSAPVALRRLRRSASYPSYYYGARSNTNANAIANANANANTYGKDDDANANAIANANANANAHMNPYGPAVVPYGPAVVPYGPVVVPYPAYPAYPHTHEGGHGGGNGSKGCGKKKKHEGDCGWPKLTPIISALGVENPGGQNE